jgi:hypothetical protein
MSIFPDFDVNIPMPTKAPEKDLRTHGLAARLGALRCGALIHHSKMFPEFEVNFPMPTKAPEKDLQSHGLAVRLRLRRYPS